jgi:prepilin peptidase CpaA
MLIESLVLLLFPAATAFCGSHDFVRMTIPNIVTGAMVMLFIAVALLVGMPLAVIGWHLAAGLCTLLVTFTLFAGGVFGGGDAKMVAAIGVWLGFDQLLPYALIAGVFGGVFALLLMQARAYPWPSMVLKFPFIARLSNEKEGIPYGVALGAAALLLYPESAVWQAAFLA